MDPLPTDPRSFHVPAGIPEPAPPTTTPPGVPPEPSRPRSRRRWPRVLAAVMWVLLLGGIGLALFTWQMWGDVERVELSGVIEGSDGGTNYLIVGTDSRSGVDTDVENAEVIFGEGLGGARTDTIAVLHVDGDGSRLLAIPRDLYVDVPGRGESRINAAFNDGPDVLIRTVQDELGIGIDHYLEVDFAGFLGLVDALGGVTIEIPYPARDERSGLDLPEAGSVELDAATPLAYVRSRNYTELREDGQWHTDPTADLGRVQRQQKFLAAVFGELGSTYNPVTMVGVVRGVKDNVRVDDTMSFTDAAALGLRLRGLSPDATTLPTTPFRTPGGAAVLLLDRAAADPLLLEFR